MDIRHRRDVAVDYGKARYVLELLLSRGFQVRGPDLDRDSACIQLFRNWHGAYGMTLRYAKAVLLDPGQELVERRVELLRLVEVRPVARALEGDVVGVALHGVQPALRVGPLRIDQQ